MVSVLVLEDDIVTREILIGDLTDHGYQVRAVTTAAQLWNSLSQHQPDLVLLDLGLPDEDGLVVATELRRKYPLLGLVMLTARDRLADRITGLRLGADAYVSKPFHFGELSAVMDSVLRRLHGASADPSVPEPSDGEWTLDCVTWRLLPPPCTTGEVKLSTNEFNFLKALARSPQQQVDRWAVVTSVSSNPNTYDQRSLDALLRRLRKKITDVTGLPAPIQTIHARGYIFTARLALQNSSHLV